MANQSKQHQPTNHVTEMATKMIAFRNFHNDNTLRLRTHNSNPASAMRETSSTSTLNSSHDDQVFAYINQCEDRETLQAFIAAAEARLATLPQHREAKLVMYKGVWFIQTGPQTGIKLCKPLSSAQVREHHARKSPSSEQFEIDKAEADRIGVSEYGWWDDDETGKRHYFRLTPYRKAKKEFKAWQALATDPIATIYRLSVDAMRQLRQLEAEGYTLIFPDD